MFCERGPQSILEDLKILGSLKGHPQSNLGLKANLLIPQWKLAQLFFEAEICHKVHPIPHFLEAHLTPPPT